MNKYNINFMNMVWNLPSWLKWRKIGKAKKGNAKKFYSAFLMNYAGNAEAEYDQIWDYSLAQLDDEDQSKFDYGDFYVLFKVVNNALEFLILCKFEPDMKRIETLFYEELDRLSGNRKVEAQDSGGRLNASV